MRSSVVVPLHNNADDCLSYMTSSNDIDSIPLAQLVQDDSPYVNVVSLLLYYYTATILITMMILLLGSSINRITVRTTAW